MNKALAVSGSIEGIRNLISKYFYGSTITLDKIDEKTWTVSTGRGLTSYIVVLSRGRYRFEEASKSNPAMENEIQKGMRIEREHADLYDYIKENGLPDRDLFYFMIARAHILEKFNYYKLLTRAGL